MHARHAPPCKLRLMSMTAHLDRCARDGEGECLEHLLVVTAGTIAEDIDQGLDEDLFNARIQHNAKQAEEAYMLKMMFARYHAPNSAPSVSVSTNSLLPLPSAGTTKQIRSLVKCHSGRVPAGASTLSLDSAVLSKPRHAPAEAASAAAAFVTSARLDLVAKRFTELSFEGRGVQKAAAGRTVPGTDGRNSATGVTRERASTPHRCCASCMIVPAQTTHKISDL